MFKGNKWFNGMLSVALLAGMISACELGAAEDNSEKVDVPAIATVSLALEEMEDLEKEGNTRQQDGATNPVGVAESAATHEDEALPTKEGDPQAEPAPAGIATYANIIGAGIRYGIVNIIVGVTLSSYVRAWEVLVGAGFRGSDGVYSSSATVD